jgi:hypothetical protein
MTLFYLCLYILCQDMMPFSFDFRYEWMEQYIWQLFCIWRWWCE